MHSTHEIPILVAHILTERANKRATLTQARCQRRGELMESERVLKAVEALLDYKQKTDEKSKKVTLLSA